LFIFIQIDVLMYTMLLIIDGYNLLFANISDKAKAFNGPDQMEKLRESMIRFIESSIPKNKYQKILIVFDGKTPSGLMRKASGISVIFSGEEEKAPPDRRHRGDSLRYAPRAGLTAEGSSRAPIRGLPIIPIPSGTKWSGGALRSGADQLIITKAKEQTNPRQVSVVTSDHDIIDVLKPMGFKIIRSQDFVNEFIKPVIDGKNKEHSPAESKEKLHGISSEEAEKWLEIFGME